MVFEDESLCVPYIEGSAAQMSLSGCHNHRTRGGFVGSARSKCLLNRYVVSFVGCRAIGVMASSHSAADKSRDGAVVARQNHSLEVVCSIHTPATFFFIMSSIGWLIR